MNCLDISFQMPIVWPQIVLMSHQKKRKTAFVASNTCANRSDILLKDPPGLVLKNADSV